MKLELVYLLKGKYCVYPRMVYKLAIVPPPPPAHFGWLKINFDRISRHFRSFQINTQLFFFTKWLPAPILDDRKSLSIAFLAKSICNFDVFFHKMAARKHFGWPKITFIVFLAISDQYATFIFWDLFTIWLLAAILDDRKSLSIAFLAISDQYTTCIDFDFFLKWLQTASLDDRKSLSIAFLAISDKYATFIFVHKMAASGHFGWPKITFDRISRYFRSIRNILFHKMAASGHFEWPKITFDRISRHLRSICSFVIFSQYGCRRPFWMTENHFRSHFSPS